MIKLETLLLATVLWAALTAAARASPCVDEDFRDRVSGADECVVIQTFGIAPAPTAASIIVWLHGDSSNGGLPMSHLRAAKEAASRFAAEGVVSIALWRPGYSAGIGRTSGGDLHGRRDHYTKANMLIVGQAIERLKTHYRPARTILVGHSGGAATAANLLGMMPGLVDAAVLVSCPCDMARWRAARAGRPWTNSEDPLQWAEKVVPPVKVIALSGTADENTPSSFAKAYVDVLVSRGVDARLEFLAGATHDSAFEPGNVMGAIASLLR